MADPCLPAVEVLDVPVYVGDVASAADEVIRRAVLRESGYAVLCNVHVLMTARARTDVMEAVRRAWVVLPDGAPVAWLQRRLGERAACRVGGPDLMVSVIDRGRVHGLRHVLVGSTPDVLQALQLRLSERFPGAVVVGSFAPGQSLRVGDPGVDLAEIRRRDPHVVWIALGAPKQEHWMRRFAPELDAPVLGVGAAFDFLAGTKRRAPEWMQRHGLEWAHRLWSEPRRLGGRYMRTNSEFILRATIEMASRRRSAWQ